MQPKLVFSAICLLLAVVYAAIAYTSGSTPDTRNSDLLIGAILYGPLLLASVAVWFRIEETPTDHITFLVLGALVFGTVLMALAGYNFAGLLVGMVNFVLAWTLAIRVINPLPSRDVD